jgi:hypothetical protein
MPDGAEIVSEHGGTALRALHSDLVSGISYSELRELANDALSP